MSLSQLKTFIVGVLKGWFTNKSVLDKFSESPEGKLFFIILEETSDVLMNLLCLIHFIELALCLDIDDPVAESLCKLNIDTVLTNSQTLVFVIDDGHSIL